MTAPMIEVGGVTKAFGDHQALDGVDLRVAAGTVVGLLGPNGAGKTTLVRILATLLDADAGWARVAGHDVRSEAQSVRSVIGLAGQYAAVDEILTGRENLELVGLLYHLGRKERKRRAAEVLERLTLTDAADRPVRTYSGGMRRRLDLGASLVGRPSVLILDEPTTGLDPATRIDLWSSIEDLVAEGTTVLLTTQYLEEADRLADRITVIDHGRVIAEGTSRELKGRLGGTFLDVTVADASLAHEAARVLCGAGHGPASVDTGRGLVALPCEGGVPTLLEAARRLEHHGIEVADMALRRPSLDDVFLALTGHPTAAHPAEAAPAEPGPAEPGPAEPTEPVVLRLLARAVAAPDGVAGPEPASVGLPAVRLPAVRLPALDSSGRLWPDSCAYEVLDLPFPPSRLWGGPGDALGDAEAARYVEWLRRVERDRAAYGLAFLGELGAPVVGLVQAPYDVLPRLGRWCTEWVPATYGQWAGVPWAVGPGGSPAGLGAPAGAATDVTRLHAVTSLAHDLTFVVLLAARAIRPELSWDRASSPPAAVMRPGEETISPCQVTLAFLHSQLVGPSRDRVRPGAGALEWLYTELVSRPDGDPVAGTRARRVAG